MIYKNTRECVLDLEKHGHLVRVHEETDPNLEMAEIHRRVFQAGGPAILFERVKGSPFPAVSNLFGTMERARFIFRATLDKVMRIMRTVADLETVRRQPWRYTGLALAGWNALPRKVRQAPVMEAQTTISQLPQIKCWPDDGGPFILLPKSILKTLWSLESCVPIWECTGFKWQAMITFKIAKSASIIRSSVISGFITPTL